MSRNSPFGSTRFRGATMLSFGATHRLELGVLLGILFICFYMTYSSNPLPEQSSNESTEPQVPFPAELEKRMRENCVGLEILRDLDECVGISNFQRRAAVTSGDDLAPEEYNGDEDLVSLESQYGLVLSYGVQYDVSTNQRKPAERYHQTLSMKCSIGFGMSVAWDMEFDDRWVQSLNFGVYETDNSTKQASPLHSFSCVELGRESAASMSIYLNCGFDIEKDAWGNPLGEADHEAVSSCIRQTFLWLKDTGANIDGVEPWNSVCTQMPNGELTCHEDIFAIDKAITP